MELVFPFILIVVGWSSDNTDSSMALQSSLHADHAGCEKAGEEFVKEREFMRAEPYNAHYKYFCVAAPGPDEYRDVFEHTK